MSSANKQKSSNPGRFGETHESEAVAPSRPRATDSENAEAPQDGPEIIPDTQPTSLVAAYHPDPYSKETEKAAKEKVKMAKAETNRPSYNPAEGVASAKTAYNEGREARKSTRYDEERGGSANLKSDQDEIEPPYYHQHTESHESQPGAVAVLGPGLAELQAARHSSIASFDHVTDDRTAETQSISIQTPQTPRLQSEHLVSAFLVQEEPPSIDKPITVRSPEGSNIAEATVVDNKKKRKQMICLLIIFFVLGTGGGVVAAILLSRGSTSDDSQPTVSPQPTESPVPSSSPTLAPTTELMQLTWFQIGDDIDGQNNDDQAGRCVALSEDGSVLAVGAENYDRDENEGHARLFRLNAKTRQWEQMGQSLEGERGKDQFGRTMSLSNDGLTVAIGSHDNDGDVNRGDLTGHVRVFGYDEENNRWEQKGDDINGEQDHTAGHFTTSFVSLAGDKDIVAFGSAESSENGRQSGRVRVFEFDANAKKWEQLGQSLDGDEAGDDFGYSVDLDDSGTTLIVGAYQRDDTDAYDNDSNPKDEGFVSLGTKPGYARIYQWNANLESWIRLGERINGAQNGDHFGSKVSISNDGKIIAIGGGSVTEEPNSAHVRVYQYDEEVNQWIQLGEDLGQDPVGQSTFLHAILGLSLSYDGQKVALGTHGFDEGQVNVFQYEMESDTWLQIGQKLSGESKGDDFGNCLKLAQNGNALAVGAPGNNAGGDDRGHAKVYYLALTASPTANPTTASPSTSPSLAPSTYLSSVKWSQIGNTIVGERGDQFGRGMSMSGDGTLVAVAARMNDNDAGEDAGSLRVYRLRNGEWQQIGQTLHGDKEGDLFGESVYVSRDGSTIAGASSDGSTKVDNRGPGYVKLYQFDDLSQSWVQLGNNIVGKNSDDKGGSGSYIALSDNGEIVAIGADYNSDNGLTDVGHVQVFEYDVTAADWTQLGDDLYGDNSRDRFGFSVYLNGEGNQLVVGAFEENSGPGYLRTFQWNGQRWNPLGQRLNGDKHNDHFGAIVTSSRDGSIMATGADLADNAGSTSGLVRVFRLVNEEWSQIGQDIVGDAGDHGGLGLSLSADGTLLAVGFRKSKLNGNKVGHAGIFQYDADSNTWKQVGKSLYGEGHDDEFSRTLDLSSDGTRAAIGANDGYVKIYETDGLFQLLFEDI